MRRRDLALLLLGLGLGAALALLVSPGTSTGPGGEDGVGDGAELAALRDRVATLEAEAAARPHPLAAAPRRDPPPAPAPPTSPPGAPNERAARAPAPAGMELPILLPRSTEEFRLVDLDEISRGLVGGPGESEAARAERTAATQRLQAIEDALSEASRRATEGMRGDLVAYAADAKHPDLAAKALARAAALKDRPFSARQATGEPDTPIAGDHGTAWAPKHPQGGLVTLELGFARAVRVDAVRVRETLAAGAVVAVAARTPDGLWVTIWEGSVAPAEAPRWFEPPVTATSFRTDRLRLTLDTDRVAGWNEIDAVELVGDGWRQWASDATASSSYAD